MRDFSVLRPGGRLVLLNVETDTLARNCEPEEAGFNSEKSLKAYMLKADTAVEHEKRGVSLVTLRSTRRVKLNRRRQLFGMLYHALGHHLVPGALSSIDKNYCENAADLFRIQKEAQSFGPDNTKIDKLIYRRAKNFLFKGHAESFTSFALQALKPHLGVTTLTKMRDVAQALATEHAQTEKTLTEVLNHFAALKGRKGEERRTLLAGLTAAAEPGSVARRAGEIVLKKSGF